MKPLQDDILIRRAAAKDESAFEQLMLLHQKPVYNNYEATVTFNDRWICRRRYF